MPTLRLALMGPIQVFLDDQRLTSFPTNKVLGLLVYLVCEAGRPHRRDALAGLLWPDQPEEAARANLRQTLARLRRSLGDEAHPTPFLLIDPQTIQFNPASDYTLDVADFSSLVRASERHAHRRPEICSACARRWQRAQALYAGDFLAGFFIQDSVTFEEWALVTREQLRRQAVAVLGHLGNYYEGQAEPALAQVVLARQLALDPWREEAHQQLMRLLALSGQRSAALAQYEACRRILQQELGVPPMAATTALYEAIRAGTVPAESAQLVDQNRRLAALPSPATPVVGRGEELEELAERLANPAQRLITLVGLGGIGKSRLALAAARSQARAFAQGVVFVSLAALNTTEFVAAAILTALGIDLQAQTGRREQLLKCLSQSEVLLVLDSFEHLLVWDEPAATALVADILARCPAVSLLITSRERLALSGEWLFELDGLPYPAGPSAHAQDAMGYAAVQLFVERVRQSQRQVELPPDEMTAVVRICQLVQGLPLAIELAAAARRQQPCADIAYALKNSLAALASSLRDVPPRHRSMQAACAHSWHLLAGSEQAVFGQLSVFHSFDAEAASAVAGAQEAILRSLGDKSLLRLLPDGRLELHDVLRHYAFGQLAAGGMAAAAERRHAEHYLAMAEAAEAGLLGADEGHWLTRLDCEHDNLRAALRWAMQQAEAGLALRLAGALWRFWYSRGYASEGRQWLEAALTLAAAEPEQPTPAQAKALDGAGVLAYQQGDQARTAAAYAESSTLYRALGDEAGLATVLNHIGLLRMEFGENALAIKAFEESAELSRAMGNTRGLSTALHNRGNLAFLRNDNEHAEQVYEECLALYRVTGDRAGTALLNLSLGSLARRRGNAERAGMLAEQSLALATTLGDQWTQAAATQDLGLRAYDHGDYAGATALIEAGRAAMTSLGALPSVAGSHVTLAMVARHAGDMARAEEHLRAGLALCQTGQHPILVADGLDQAARLAWAQARPEQATEFAAGAAKLRLAAAPAVSLTDLENPADLWAALSAALGPEAFAAHWAIGQALTSEQAIAAVMAF